MIPRGIRNNNPGNIRKGPSPWMEKKAISTDADFEQFTHPRYGIRALGMLLQNYQRSYNLNTVGTIIPRYAPSTENDTLAYIDNVCSIMGVYKNQFLNLKDESVLLSLMVAIIKHENNNQQPYYSRILMEALDLIGET